MILQEFEQFLVWYLKSCLVDNQLTLRRLDHLIWIFSLLSDRLYSLVLLHSVNINVCLIYIRYKGRWAIISLDLQLRPELTMSDTLDEILSSFSGSLSSHNFFLCIFKTFFRCENLLRSEVLEDRIPYLQEDWTQLLLDILRKILS